METKKNKLAEYKRQWYEANREKILARAARYREKNKEKIAEYQKLIPKEKKKAYRQKVKVSTKAYMRIYRQENKAKILEKSKEWQRKKLATDLNYRIASNLRKRLGKAIKRNDKKGSSVRNLGCSIDALKKYLELKFKPGMTWDNWSVKGWHIDHIRPLSSFDLTDIDQFNLAVHYTNLQPLWATENLLKKDNYE